jgi:hypothetical protein
MKPHSLVPALVLCTSAAACSRPAPQTVEMPPPPVTLSLTATTVRRTDTAAPAEAPAAAVSSTAVDGGVVAGDLADGGTVAASSPDASAPAPSSAPPTESTIATAALAGLDAQHAGLARCYDELLSTAPDAIGRVNVELAVTSANEITRVDVRVEGESPLASARSCIEAALRAGRFTATPAVGAVIRRSYSFVNPAIELAAPSPVRVQAPARNGRAGDATPAAAGAAASADAGAAASADAGASGAPTVRGVLTAAEVGEQLGQAVAALQTCYGTALRRASRAAGGGELRFSIQPDGQVASATWGASSEPIALMGECIGAAVRARRFRASGSPTNVRATVEFAR